MPNAVYLPGRWKPEVKECEKQEADTSGNLFCVEKKDRRWMSNCKSDECQAVPVNIHYMLSEDLGTSNHVVVEAFDNAKFSGSPISILDVTNFDASRAGTHSEDVIFLEPGVYYFRAYISKDHTTVVPYEYQGMELVGDQPVGYFGALSEATKAIIDGRGDWTSSRSVNIYLDKLMKRAGTEAPSHAHLRLQLTLEQGIEVPLGVKVLIQLFAKDDFSFDPDVSYDVASENFKVEGQLGKTEFISPDMAPGQYFIRTFLDLSKNGYYDDGEPLAVFEKNTEHARVSIQEHRTESIALVLKKIEVPVPQ